jgi:hypothetical protein
MAKTPTLLDEALGALKALKTVQPSNWDDHEYDAKVYKQADRVLAKASKQKAA